MVDREMLTAMSEMMDQKLDQKLDQKFDEKLKPVYDRLDKLDFKVEQLESNVMPRLYRLESDMKYVREEQLHKVETDITYIKEEQLENNVMPRLDKLETDITYVKEEQLENNVMPRLDRLEADMKVVRVDQLENGIIPRLNTIEGYYLDTSKRYHEKTEQIDTMSSDIAVLKSVVSNHSTRLSKIPV